MITKNKRLLQQQAIKYNVHMYDFRLMLYVLILGSIGILVINSAADGFAPKQMIGFIGGFGIMIIFSLIDYNYIAKYEWFLYSINIGVLVIVKLFGKNVNGSTRWFSLGPFGTLQPSEISKVIMLIVFSYIISEHKEKINQLSTLLRIAFLYVIPTLLIVIEPDLSTSLVFVFLFCTLLFVAEISYKIIGTVLCMAAAVLGLVMWNVQLENPILLRDYQVERIRSFLNPSDYLLTTFNQQYNSMMAIGSGMLKGKGLNSNTITSVKGGNFISEPQTDFIFAIVGEELGFIGACVVLALLALIVIECLHIAKDARDMRGRLIASGAASVIAFQTFVNVGVATGLLPNTGLPLPFVSYGLSSLLSNFLFMGLVLNVGLQRNRR